MQPTGWTTLQTGMVDTRTIWDSPTDNGPSQGGEQMLTEHDGN
jgi:hypothetical protein